MIRKLMPFVVFETPADGGAAAPPAAAAPEPVAPAPPQPEPVGEGPWAQDIRSTFQDPEVQRQVDAFLRSKVQPHVTQVEQQYAPARELWQDLQAEDQAQSLGTYVAVAEQLYGAEVAQAVAASLEAQFTQPQQPETPAPAQPQLTPEQQQAIDWANAQQAEQLYQSELARVKQADPNVQDHLFHPFVVGAEGDFDQALASYQQWHAQAYPAAPPEPAPEPPATLDAQGAPAAIPPTNPPQETFDSALESTLAEMRAQRGAPATVGQV